MNKLSTEVLAIRKGDLKIYTLKQEPKFKDGWGETIKDLRESRRMTIDDLSKNLGVNKGTVSRWEHEISVPDAKIAVKLAKILRTTVEDIFDI